MADDSDQIEVEGLRIAFRRRGEGPPLVLLHGGLSDGREWRRQLDRLSDEFTVVAWDAPGCGQSSDPPETFRMPEYADCLAAFIKALGLDRPHVLGLSFGGALALELYRRHPAVPRTLVLVSAYAGWAGSLPAEVVEQRLQHALRQSEMLPEQVGPGTIPGLFPESTPAEVVDELVAIMSGFHRVGAVTMPRALAEANLRDVLPRITVPTLLVYGDSDARAPVSLAEDLHARIPASKLVVILGAGHQSNMEAADRFNSEVRNFLRSVSA